MWNMLFRYFDERQSPHPVFSGATPIDWLRKGHGEEVLTEARQVGRGQD